MLGAAVLGWAGLQGPASPRTEVDKFICELGCTAGNHVCFKYVCVYAHAHVCVRVCIYIHTHMYVCIYTCVHMYMDCMSVYIYIQTYRALGKKIFIVQ